MNLVVIVEGTDDYETYPILIRRIRNDVERLFRVQCGGVRKLKTTFVPSLKYYQARRDLNVAKALVVRDSDCKDVHPLETELDQILRGANTKLAFPVHFYATKCELESWLLADEGAINRVSASRGGPGGITPVNLALEMHKDAKALFHRVLWEAGLQVTPRVYAEIAQAADLQRIAQRCPYFREFMARVQAC